MKVNGIGYELNLLDADVADRIEAAAQELADVFNARIEELKEMSAAKSIREQCRLIDVFLTQCSVRVHPIRSSAASTTSRRTLTPMANLWTILLRSAIKGWPQRQVGLRKGYRSPNPLTRHEPADLSAAEIRCDRRPGLCNQHRFQSRYSI